MNQAAPAASARQVLETQLTPMDQQSHDDRLGDCPMMRLLGRDSGARQSLLQFLSLPDMVPLVASARWWSSWLASALGSRHVNLYGSYARCHSFERCEWIQRAVQSIRFTGSAWEEESTDQFFRCIPRLARVRSLDLSFTDRFDAPLLRESLLLVSPTLVDFRLVLSPQKLLWDITGEWAAVGVLRGLLSLHVDLAGQCPRRLDLSFLSSMPRLERLSLILSTVLDEATVELLAQCRALTDLRCGQWLPPTSLTRSKYAHNHARAALIQSRFALLARRRTENGGAPLRRLWLGDDPDMGLQDWRLVGQFTELETLDASWSLALTAGDWLQLRHFQQLRFLAIRDDRPFDSPLDLCNALSPLLQCPSLRHLTLEGRFGFQPQHVSLVSQLPLERLVCRHLRIVSLDPLSASSSITDLEFGWCTDLRGKPLNVRALLPPMSLVDHLSIHEYEDHRMTAVAASSLTVSLLQRLPNLAPENFIQAFREEWPWD